MMEWLAPSLVAAVAGVVGYVWGRRVGSRPWREEKRQRELERTLMEESGYQRSSTTPTAVVRRARIARSHLWKEDE